MPNPEVEEEAGEAPHPVTCDSFQEACKNLKRAREWSERGLLRAQNVSEKKGFSRCALSEMSDLRGVEAYQEEVELSHERSGVV